MEWKLAVADRFHSDLGTRWGGREADYRVTQLESMVSLVEIAEHWYSDSRVAAQLHSGPED